MLVQDISISTYTYKVSDLDITSEEIGEVSKMGDAIECFREFIDNEIIHLNNISTIRGAIRIVQSQGCSKATFEAEDMSFNVGKLISGYLRKSQSYAFFICSAGKEVSARSKELMDAGDLMEGYIVDVIGNMMVEKAMDEIQILLREEMSKEGRLISNRYSPGYCEWEVSEQPKLFSLFPKETAGVTLTESCLMQPIKSISGVIGIGEKIKFHPHVCHQCSSVNCLYRKDKTN